MKLCQNCTEMEKQNIYCCKVFQNYCDFVDTGVYKPSTLPKWSMDTDIGDALHFHEKWCLGRCEKGIEMYPLLPLLLCWLFRKWLLELTERSVSLHPFCYMLWIVGVLGNGAPSGQKTTSYCGPCSQYHSEKCQLQTHFILPEKIYIYERQFYLVRFPRKTKSNCFQW